MDFAQAIINEGGAPPRVLVAVVADVNRHGVGKAGQQDKSKE